MRIWKGIFLIACLGFTGCKPGKLEQALRQSGDNRAELEKVLAFYARDPKDSLRLKAAVFLIENMPGHTTWGGDYINRYCEKIRTAIPREENLQRVLYALPGRHPLLKDSLVRQEDIRTMSAGRLIGHIQKAFRQKAECPWLAQIDFLTFCESVLPYSMAGYDLSRKWYTPPAYCRELAFAIRHFDDCRYSVAMAAACAKNIRVWPTRLTLPDSTLGEYLFTKADREIAHWIACCTSGIPVALDFLPVRNHLNIPHHWVCCLDSRLRPVRPARLQELKVGKIFRKTYARQPVPQPAPGEYVPSFFRNPFQKDVTALYLQTIDITLPFAISSPNRYAYLSIYDREEWQSVGYAPIENGRCRFSQVGKNCLYLPVYYPDSLALPFAAPFILHRDGRREELRPDTAGRQTMRLVRLRPYYHFLREGSNLYADCRFECADDPAFRNVDTVYTIPGALYFQNETVPVDTSLKRRYWRIIVPVFPRDFAEIHFFDARGQEMAGSCFGPDMPDAGRLRDRNPATYKTVWKWLGVDFGKAVSVASITYMPRNDGFNIYPGHLYEIEYCGKQGWQRAGRCRAEDFYLEFPDVPSGALYRLCDLTGRTVGGIFTWENGKQKFW